MGLVELEKKVLEWAAERGLLKAENADKQAEQVISEVGELAGAVLRNDTEQILLEMGDVIVSSINLAHILGFSFVERRVVRGYTPTAYSAYLDYYFCLFQFAKHRNELSACIAFEAIDLICSRECITPEQALSAAYNKIKNRKGRTENGTFVKEAESIPCPVCGSQKTYKTEAVHCGMCATNTEIDVCATTIEVSGVQLPVASYSVDGKHIYIEKSYHDMWRVAKQGNVMSAKDGYFYWLRFPIETQADIAEFLFSTPEQAYESYLKFHGNDKKQQQNGD